MNLTSLLRQGKQLCSLKSLFKLVLPLILVLAGMQPLSADPCKGRGLVPLSERQTQHIENNWSWIVDVKPSKIGLHRINEHLVKNRRPILKRAAVEMGPAEFVVVKGLKAVKAATPANYGGVDLPRHVDNSTLPSFPPIGDQQMLGSCVAWGSTYYQATHEYGLLNGANNKNSNDFILSPKWTYNILNGGQDGGLEILSAFSLLQQNGAATWNQFGYDGNYLSWDINAQDWVSAINFRMNPPQLIAGIGGNQQDLTVIKQLLTNGHILVFGTYIDSWVFTKVKSDPQQPSPYAGQLAAAWMNGYSGGHCMTIVGYDDDVWIDINGDGVVDPGEKGAFLIANSWSDQWGNDGFVWVSYDAFRAVSAVPNGPNNHRVPLADAMNSYVVSMTPKAHNYSPKLVAEFALSQTQRDQIGVSVGVSDTNTIKPSATFQNYALSNQGGPFRFDGQFSGAPETATFALDMTDLLPAQITATPQRFYLLVSDDAVRQPTRLQSFVLNDLVHHTQVSHPQVPLTCDNSQIMLYVDYNLLDGTTVADVTAPQVKLTSPLENSVLSGRTGIVVAARDSVGINRVELYVDNRLVGIDRSAPFFFSLNTRNFKDGKHVFKVIAYNKLKKTAVDTVDVVIKNKKP